MNLKPKYYVKWTNDIIWNKNLKNGLEPYETTYFTNFKVKQNFIKQGLKYQKETGFTLYKQGFIINKK